MNSLSDYTKKASRGLLSSKYLGDSQKALKEDELQLKFNELEKIATRCLELVICDVKKCEARGDYWKCYMGNYLNCPIYLSYLRNAERQKPKRHH